jgi:hypothetical protein
VALARQYDTLRQPGKSRLREMHSSLDDAVRRAYGFSPKDDELAQLLALNQDIVLDSEVARGPGGHGLPVFELVITA